MNIDLQNIQMAVEVMRDKGASKEECFDALLRLFAAYLDKRGKLPDNLKKLLPS